MSSVEEEGSSEASSDLEDDDEVMVDGPEQDFPVEMDLDGNFAAPSDDFWENFQDRYVADEDEVVEEVSHPPEGAADPPSEPDGEDKRHKPSLPGTRTEWHPHGGRTFGRRKDIFEKIRTDSATDGKTREHNVYHPFRDEMDYQMGRHLSKLNIPMTELDDLLKLKFVCFKLSYFRIMN